MARNMGLDFGLEKKTTCFKRKFRWLLKIPDICAMGIQSLPPVKGARPSVSLKEIEVQHLNETIYFPQKAEWKTVTFTLFDLKRNEHPIFKWLTQLYDPTDTGTWSPIKAKDFKKKALLELYDGCGNIIEKWVYENAYPQTIEFGELDMSNSDYLTIEITLRYDRAYIDKND